MCSGKCGQTTCKHSRMKKDMSQILSAIGATEEQEQVILESQEESVLLEAHRIVSKRNDAYGEPTDTAERVSIAFSALTKREIKPADVALIQILFKIVRSEHGYKRDNSVDLAGYTDIRERCLLKEKAN